MPRVICDLNCRHNKEDICQKDKIRLGFDGCNEYDPFSDEELHPDVFYKKIKPDIWEKTRGKKVEFLGREMFIRYGNLNDGKTGALVCPVWRMDEVKENKEEFLKRAQEFEVEYGISPLYTS